MAGVGICVGVNLSRQACLPTFKDWNVIFVDKVLLLQTMWSRWHNQSVTRSVYWISFQLNA